MLTSITIRKVLALAVALAVLMTLAQKSGRLDPIWRVVTRSPAPAWSAGFTAPQDDELASGRWFGPPSCLISARANCDCQVDLGDLARVAGAWRCQAGDGCYDPYRDVNDDGSIDVADAAFALLRWGEVCW
jgi:hypothetical protein